MPEQYQLTWTNTWLRSLLLATDLNALPAILLGLQRGLSADGGPWEQWEQWGQSQVPES